MNFDLLEEPVIPVADLPADAKAIRVRSERAGEDVWVVLVDAYPDVIRDYRSKPDGRAVFYKDEIELLGKMSDVELRMAVELKRLAPGSRIKEKSNEEKAEGPKEDSLFPGL